MCSTAHTKIAVVKSILARHPDEPTLVIGASGPARRTGCGVERTGDPGVDEERRTRGTLRRLPSRRDQDGLVGVEGGELLHRSSGSLRGRSGFGHFRSRQEEAQRLGRLLRPKADGGGAVFYSVVSRDSLDAEYAAHRQRFLASRATATAITDADDLLGPAI